MTTPSKPKPKKTVPKPATTKKKAKEEVPQKKKGRPTKEEARQKQIAAAAAVIAHRKELIELQKQVAADTTGSVVAPDNLPKYPIFLPGQRVSAEYNGITYKGTIAYDSLESGMVRVRWDDGSNQYAAKANLQVIPKKVYKKLFNHKSAMKEVKAKQ